MLIVPHPAIFNSVFRNCIMNLRLKSRSKTTHKTIFDKVLFNLFFLEAVRCGSVGAQPFSGMAPRGHVTV